jgi:hypothetical protein
VPFRLNAAIGVGAVLVALPGAFLATCTERPAPELEPSGTRLTVLRLSWLLGWLAAFAAVGLFATRASVDGLTLSLRNLALTAGLTLLAGQWMPALFAWLPAAFALGVTFVYGTSDVVGSSRWWALPLKPTSDVPSGLVAAVLLAAGGFLYVTRDGRPTLDP